MIGKTPGELVSYLNAETSVTYEELYKSTGLTLPYFGLHTCTELSSTSGLHVVLA